MNREEIDAIRREVEKNLLTLSQPRVETQLAEEDVEYFCRVASGHALNLAAELGEASGEREKGERKNERLREHLGEARAEWNRALAEMYDENYPDDERAHRFLVGDMGRVFEEFEAALAEKEQLLDDIEEKDGYIADLEDEIRDLKERA
jgi:hypothetical protein